MARTRTTSIVKAAALVAVIAALLVFIAAPVPVAAQSDSDSDSNDHNSDSPDGGDDQVVGGGDPVIYVGSAADACGVPGRVEDTCACTAVALTGRSSVLAPVEASMEWCDVRPRSFTQYFCDEAGATTCKVVCTGPKYYCAAGSLRFGGKQCECALTGNRLVVVPKW